MNATMKQSPTRPQLSGNGCGIGRADDIGVKKIGSYSQLVRVLRHLILGPLAQFLNNPGDLPWCAGRKKFISSDISKSHERQDRADYGVIRPCRHRSEFSSCFSYDQMFFAV